MPRLLRSGVRQSADRTDDVKVDCESTSSRAAEAEAAAAASPLHPDADIASDCVATASTASITGTASASSRDDKLLEPDATSGQLMEVVIEHVSVSPNDMPPPPEQRPVMPATMEKQRSQTHCEDLVPPVRVLQQKLGRESVKAQTRRVAALRVRGPMEQHAIDEVGDVFEELVMMYSGAAGVTAAAEDTSATRIPPERAVPSPESVANESASQTTGSQRPLMNETINSALKQLRADLICLRDKRQQQKQRAGHVLQRAEQIVPSVASASTGSRESSARDSNRTPTPARRAARDSTRTALLNSATASASECSTRAKDTAYAADTAGHKTRGRPKGSRNRKSLEEESPEAKSPEEKKRRMSDDKSAAHDSDTAPATVPHPKQPIEASQRTDKSDRSSGDAPPPKRKRTRITFAPAELQAIEQVLRLPRAQFPAEPCASKSNFFRVVARAAISRLYDDSPDYVNRHTEYTFAVRVAREYRRLRESRQIDPFGLRGNADSSQQPEAGGEQPEDSEESGSGPEDEIEEPINESANY